MQRFASYVTYSDNSGSYSDGGEFAASHWSDAIEIATAKARDTARGDYQELVTLIARRDDSNEIASFSARCTGESGFALVTITEL